MRSGSGTIYLKSFYLYSNGGRKQWQGIFSPNSNSPKRRLRTPALPFPLAPRHQVGGTMRRLVKSLKPNIPCQRLQKKTP